MSSPETRKKPLRIAILGSRGIPANYGGFETFAEELSTRLVRRGHEVTVYGRVGFIAHDLENYRGVRIRVLRCVRSKYLETVSHTFLSVLHAWFCDFDVLVVCNAANAFLCGLPKLAGQKVVLNVDGIERRRRKWNSLGRAFYRLGEFLATLLPETVVADARTIQDYYLDEYGLRARYIPYGASVEVVSSTEKLKQLRLCPREYVLYVSRLEPENNAMLAIEAYLNSGVPYPLVVVGDAPYAQAYIRGLRRLAAGRNVLMPGAVYGAGYRELLAHCFCYIQATEVGGTHPALLEAMGAGALVLANDTPEHREVIDEAGLIYPFNSAGALAALLRRVYTSREDYQHLRAEARRRIAECYDWEAVVDQYEACFHELAEGA
jgi:glycosyltransferase involved in cell wall biosynthesis